MRVSHLEVADSNMVLAIDLRMEQERAELYMPLLLKHGFPGGGVRFDYDTYQPLKFEDRCFDNAMETALRYGLKYMEGLMICKLAQGGYFQLAHGWCLDADGKIVDPTCHKNQHHKSVIYYGVGIKTQYSLDWKQRMGYYGCLDGAPDGTPCGPYVDPVKAWLA